MSTQTVDLQFRHPARPAAIGRARREVEEALAATGVLAGTCGDVLLVVSELVTNAVRHSRTEEFEVRIAVEPGRVRLEVRDDGPGFEPRISPSRDRGGGYGLFIVDRIADRWGVERGDGGRIWLELDRTG